MDDDAEHFDIYLPDYHFHYVNETNIIFDEKLKLFIKEMREHLNNKFDRHDKSLLFEKQNYAIKYVKSNKSKLTLKNNRLNTKPDMFCINICLFINIDLYSSFEKMDIKSILTNLRFNKRKIFKQIKLEEVDKYDSISDMRYRNIDVIGSLKGECCCSKKNIQSDNITYCINEKYSCYFGCDCIEKSNIHTKKAIAKKIKEEVNKEKERLKQIKLQRKREIENIKIKLENKLSTIIKQKINKEYNDKCKIIFNKINSQSELLKFYNFQVDGDLMVSESRSSEEDAKYYLEKRYLYNWYDYKESIKSFGGKWDSTIKKWYFVNKKKYNDFHKLNNISYIDDLI